MSREEGNILSPKEENIGASAEESVPTGGEYEETVVSQSSETEEKEEQKYRDGPHNIALENGEDDDDFDDFQNQKLRFCGCCSKQTFVVIWIVMIPFILTEWALVLYFIIAPSPTKVRQPPAIYLRENFSMQRIGGDFNEFFHRKCYLNKDAESALFQVDASEKHYTMDAKAEHPVVFGLDQNQLKIPTNLEKCNNVEFEMNSGGFNHEESCDSGTLWKSQPKTLVDAIELAAYNDELKHTVALAMEPLGVKGAESLPLNKWDTWTWRQYYEESRDAAYMLMGLGLEKFGSVTVNGFNSPHWNFVTFGTAYAGAKVAGILSLDEPVTIAFKTLQVGADIAVVGQKKELDATLKAMTIPKVNRFYIPEEFFREEDNDGDRSLCLQYIITYGMKGFKNEQGELVDMVKYKTYEAEGEESEFKQELVSMTSNDSSVESNLNGCTTTVVTWEKAKKLGADFLTEGDFLEELPKRKVHPGNAAAVVHTSGTTGGLMKGAMLSHDNLVFATMTAADSIPEAFSGSKVRMMSYLPLAHVAAMAIDVVAPAVVAAQLCVKKVKRKQVTVYFTRPNDIKNMGLRLLTVRPTNFMAVPKVWEKMQETILAKTADISGIKKSLGRWGKALLWDHANKCQLQPVGSETCSYQPMWRFANALVATKAKKAMGLDAVTVAVSAAGDISENTLNFFASLGIHIRNVWGMSETSGAAIGNRPSTDMWSSIGFPAQSIFAKIDSKISEGGDKKEDSGIDMDCSVINRLAFVESLLNQHTLNSEGVGELKMKGRTIMMGYIGNEEKLGKAHVRCIKAANEKSFDQCGWLRTGDAAAIDKRGMYKLVGRVKDVIKPRNGEQIVPTKLEDLLKQELGDLVDKVVIVGNGRENVTVLVTLKNQGTEDGLKKGNLEFLDAGKVNDLVKGNKYKNVGELLKGLRDGDKTWSELIMKAVKRANKLSGSKLGPNNFAVLPYAPSIPEDVTPTFKIKRLAIEKKHAPLLDLVDEHMHKGKWKPSYAETIYTHLLGLLDDADKSIHVQE